MRVREDDVDLADVFAVRGGRIPDREAAAVGRTAAQPRGAAGPGWLLRTPGVEAGLEAVS